MKYFFYFLCLLSTITGCKNRYANYHTFDGFTMGTTYHIICDTNFPDKVQKGIDSLLTQIDNSLSAYNEHSVISKINRNEPVEADSLFVVLFRQADEVYKTTNGAFDISASPLFNAWGFGFKHKELLTQEKIDSLKLLIGMEHIKLDGVHIIKDDPRVSLNANAIAKGLGTDVTANYLEQSGCNNYLVEIGGEIRCKGKSKKGKQWSVAIDKPVDGNIFPGENIQTVLWLTDKALATSGNYRRYYEENGKKYGHTIDPVTGHPVTNSLLSATVITDKCALADAYATAFMVIGLDATKQLLSKHPELDVYLLYEENGETKSFYTTNVATMIQK